MAKLKTSIKVTSRIREGEGDLEERRRTSRNFRSPRCGSLLYPLAEERREDFSSLDLGATVCAVLVEDREI